MHDSLVFSPFRIDLAGQQLLLGDKPVRLRPRTFDVLLYLATNPGKLVTKQELLDTIWKGVVVSDELLRGYIREVRKVLGDDAGQPRFVETVASRGYRFLPRVEFEPKHEAAIPPDVEDMPKGAAIGPAKASLRIGVLHSLTGTLAWTEGPVVDATLLAVEEINQSGGINGTLLEPIVRDGESDENMFTKRAEELIDEHVCTIFGCWTSASRKCVREIVEERQHLLMYPTQYEGLEQSANIFYLGAAPNQQIIPAVRWALGFLGKKQVYLVGWNSVYSHAANAIIRDEVESLGGRIVGEEYIQADSFDVVRVVRHIAQTGPQIIFNSLVGDVNVFYTRLLRSSGITSEKVPSVYLSAGEIELQSLSSAETKGDFAAWNYFQSVDRPQNRSFIQRLRQRHGHHRVTADPMEAAYAGVHLWVNAMRKAESSDTGSIRAALRTESLDAPSGRLQIDPENQHTWKTVRIGEVVDGGQFEIRWSSEIPVRPLPFPSTRSPEQWTQFLEQLQRLWDGWTKREIRNLSEP